MKKTESKTKYICKFHNTKNYLSPKNKKKYINSRPCIKNKTKKKIKVSYINVSCKLNIVGQTS